MPAEVVKAHPQVLGMLQGLTADPAYANVVVLSTPIDAPALPAGLDEVLIRQNYHDLHDKFMGPADVAAFNRNVFAALKPGGVYVVLDHADVAGAGLKDTDTLHRIDEASVKAEVLAAGFKLDGESHVLANPADDHTKNVFDPSIRGKTDQFLLRFRKPG
jgi:predicted methyltransferase